MSERRRFRRFRRRTADVCSFNNRPAIIRRDNEEDTIDEDVTSTITNDRLGELRLAKAESTKPDQTARRNSIKRDREEDLISVGNKRRSVGSDLIRSERIGSMSLMDSPPLSHQSGDILKPLSLASDRVMKKARRRRSIAVTKDVEYESETPTKSFNGLKDILTLTPETDDETCKLISKKENKIYSRPIDQSEWMTVKDIFSSMKNDAFQKWVPCPVATEQSSNMIQERHRQILIEWLIEVATEERYRRTTFHLCLSILDRYLYYTKQIQKNDLQAIGTAALFLAAKLEEVVPPDIYKLVDFSDGAVDITHLIKIEAAICQILKWKINSVTPLQFLLLYLQSPSIISTKPLMPNFNSVLLFYSTTILDVTRLDTASYIYPFHIISASIIIRLLDYIELDDDIQKNMKLLEAPFSISSSTKIKSFIQCHVSNSEIKQCLNYVTPGVIVLMNDVVAGIRTDSFPIIPQCAASHGCSYETSRLQSNLAGEQGTVDMLQRTNCLRSQLAEARQSDKMSIFLQDNNIPADYILDENIYSGHENLSNMDPVSPP